MTRFPALATLLSWSFLALSGCRSGAIDVPSSDGGDSLEDSYRLGSFVPPMPARFESHRPACSDVLALEDLPIRLFADDGHLFHFEVTPRAASAGNSRACDDDSPPAGVECPNYATNVRVVPWGATYCADTGKVELDLRGGKNFRSWLEIPTLRFDSAEFRDQSFSEGDSKLRFHNGQSGATVLREAIALRIWRALGYPAPRSAFVKTQSNVWDTAFGPGTWATHLMLQSYKKQFFKTDLPDADSVWEGKGDPLDEGWKEVECEWSAEDDCNDSALRMVIAQIRAEQQGPGFRERTSSFVDWPSIDAFRCLSALTDTGNDWLHTADNVVLVLTELGMLRYLPHRLDRSAGMSDEPSSFEGHAYLTRMCATDPDCESAAASTCETLLDEFDRLDLITTVVRERCDTLTTLGLDRDGDDQACEELRDYYESAADRVRGELE